jgi:hypothetical protein
MGTHEGRWSFSLSTGPFTVELPAGAASIDIYRTAAGRSHGFLSLVPGGGDPHLRVLDPGAITLLEPAPDDSGVRVAGSLGWAAYTLDLRLPRTSPGLVVSQVVLRPVRALGPSDRLFDGTHCELSYRERDAYRHPKMVYYLNGTPGSFTYHTVDDAGGIADLNQFLFFGDPDILDATVFQFVDFTALRAFYERTGTAILDTVAQPPGCLSRPAYTYMGQPFDLGYDVPAARAPVVPGEELPVTRTLLLLSPGSFGIRETTGYAARFVDSVAAIWPHVAKPTPRFVDWPDVTEKGLVSLREYRDSPDCKYVLLPQANLNSLERYARAFGSPLCRELLEPGEGLIERFTLKLPFGDAWQYVFPIIQIGEYAMEFGSAVAMKKFLGAADDVVKAGQRLGYRFPLRIRDDFTREDDIRYEYDVTGVYVYLMLLYHHQTGEERYLAEARAAAEVMLGQGFEMPYEFTGSALCPLALLRLFKATGERRYLDGSLIPLAAILRHSWFFDPGYREYRGRSIFLLTEGMPGVYANGWEEASLLHYLPRYLAEGAGALAPHVVNLVSELLRYKCAAQADSLAPLLPDPSIIYDGIPREWHRPVERSWYIPMEGFGYLEWDKSGLHDRPGRVSQPPYCFGPLPEAALLQFHPLGRGAVLYVEAPIVLEREGERTFRFRVLATRGTFRAGVRGSVAVDAVTPRHDTATGLEAFEVEAGRTCRLEVTG